MIGKESKQDDLAAWGIKHKPGVLDRMNMSALSVGFVRAPRLITPLAVELSIAAS